MAKVFALESNPETRELREFSTRELKTELAALRRDMAKGFADHDAMTAVELELQARGVK